MGWLSSVLRPGIKKEASSNTKVPEGVWVKCPHCDEVLYTDDVAHNLNICPKCNYHMRLNARARINMLLDPEGRELIGDNVRSKDPLKFKDSKKYPDRLNDATKSSGETDAIVVQKGKLHGHDVVVAVFEFSFMGGSMGSVVGERFVRGVQAAIEAGCPFICVSASGGARMQESMFSLMQMAKTTAILTQLSKAGLPFFSVLTDPTMGGVSASFAFLGDVVIAEPNALVGFAGQRVIEQTVREQLPAGFQRAEFLLDKGAIDCVLPRQELKAELAHMIALMMKRPETSVQ